MSLPLVNVDENYKHDSLDWFYRLKIKKAKGGGHTAVRQKGMRISDVARLIELSHDEHADCDLKLCEVRQVLAKIENDSL